MAYPQDVKAQVVASVLGGRTQREVEKQFGVPQKTIHMWMKNIEISRPEKKGISEGIDERKCIKKGISEGIDVRHEPDGVALGRLIEEYLCEELRCVTFILRQIQEGEWVARQSASDLGHLVGIVSDKIIIKLAAMERARERDLRAIELSAGERSVSPVAVP